MMKNTVGGRQCIQEEGASYSVSASPPTSELYRRKTKTVNKILIGLKLNCASLGEKGFYGLNMETHGVFTLVEALHSQAKARRSHQPPLVDTTMVR